MPQVQLLVSGQVQGVFYRMHCHKKATALKLTGFVRNLPDGRVEVYAEGEEEILQALIDWCHEGPPAAQVDNVEVLWADGEDRFQDFRIAG
ncbi:MAG: acylphosphatase [Deltaproteobacteria bacterium]|nr:acylphosphatase [Deltaproteobacteria bacterium]